MSVFIGFVNEMGKLTLDYPRAFLNYVGRFRGEEVEVKVQKRKVQRSERQNRAFHVMVQPWCLSEGHNIEDLKVDLLREVFGEREAVNALTGKVRKALVEPHTSTLSVEQFSHLMERTAELAAGCGVILELPDEYTTRKKAEEKRTEGGGMSVKRLTELEALEESVDVLAEAATAAQCDWFVKITTAIECCWAAELRLTPPNYGDGMGVTFTASGGSCPCAVAQEVIATGLRWLRELRQRRQQLNVMVLGQMDAGLTKN